MESKLAKKIFQASLFYVGVTTLSLLLIFSIYGVDEGSGLMITKADWIIGCISNLIGLAAAAYSFYLKRTVRSWEESHGQK